MEDIEISTEIEQKHEEKKPGFFKKLFEKKSGQILFFVVSMVVLLGVFPILSKKITDERRIQHAIEREARETFVVLGDIERVICEKDSVRFEGWAFSLDSQQGNTTLVFDATDSDEVLAFNAIRNERLDVTTYFSLDSSLGDTGLYADMNLDNFKENVCYRIFIDVSYKIKREETGFGGSEIWEKKATKIETNKYFYNGNLYDYDPTNYTHPDVVDNTELNDVIERGILRAYDLQEQIWIYQYANTLYYILGNQYGLLSEANLCIPVMPRTSKEEFLPEGKNGNDHLGTFLENEEYLKEGILPYQVVKVELNVEYPITYIFTGLYNREENDWIKSFRIITVDLKK